MIRKGSTVLLKEPVLSYVRGKMIPKGTEGLVLAMRDTGEGGVKLEEYHALVKFRTFHWPRSLAVSKLEEV